MAMLKPHRGGVPVRGFIFIGPCFFCRRFN